MSAFIVAKAHIDYLVHAAQITHTSMYLMEDGRVVRLLDPRTDADEIGRRLWAENLASVAYRYPDHDERGLPGPVGFDHETIAAYTCPLRMFSGLRFNPVATLKAIQCYDYQSCEHPGWEDSDARRFCEHLMAACIAQLPDYDAAPWEISADTRIPA